jgi:hypothetical protein
MKNLIEKAVALYELNQQIKALTDEADALKKTLRLEMTDELVLTDIGMICKKVAQTAPVIDNEKLYKKLTMEELVVATKPVLGELKKIYTDKDEYDEVIEEVAASWTVTECIKYAAIKK